MSTNIDQSSAVALSIRNYITNNKRDSLESRLLCTSKRVLLESNRIDFTPASSNSNTHIDAIKKKYPPLKRDAGMTSFGIYSQTAEGAGTSKVLHNNHANQNGERREMNGNGGSSPSPGALTYTAYPKDMPKPKVELSDYNDVSIHWPSSMTNGNLFLCKGLINLGNTCYMNSVVQVLSHTPPFILYLISNHRSPCLTPDCYMCMFKDHITDAKNSLHNKYIPYIKPIRIVSKLQKIWNGKRSVGTQEDAQEFFLNLFNKMHKSLLYGQPGLDEVSKNTTIINKIFSGFLRSQVVCSQCNTPSNTYDSFLTLSLDISSSHTWEEQDIKQALHNFTRKEALHGDNAYCCARCKKKVLAYKRFQLCIPPLVLIIHLKRFTYSSFGARKLNTPVAFPEMLDIKPYMSNAKHDQAPYKLYGVVCHEGSHVNHGHYYAFARVSNGRFYQFNDSHVHPVSPQCVLNNKSRCYLLFYTITSHPTSHPPPTMNGNSPMKSPSTSAGGAHIPKSPQHLTSPKAVPHLMSPKVPQHLIAPKGPQQHLTPPKVPQHLTSPKTAQHLTSPKTAQHLTSPTKPTSSIIPQLPHSKAQLSSNEQPQRSVPVLGSPASRGTGASSGLLNISEAYGANSSPASSPNMRCETGVSKPKITFTVNHISSLLTKKKAREQCKPASVERDNLFDKINASLSSSSPHPDTLRSPSHHRQPTPLPDTHPVGGTVTTTTTTSAVTTTIAATTTAAAVTTNPNTAHTFSPPPPPITTSHVVPPAATTTLEAAKVPVMADRDRHSEGGGGRRVKHDTHTPTKHEDRTARERSPSLQKMKRHRSNSREARERKMAKVSSSSHHHEHSRPDHHHHHHHHHRPHHDDRERSDHHDQPRHRKELHTNHQHAPTTCKDERRRVHHDSSSSSSSYRRENDKQHVTSHHNSSSRYSGKGRSRHTSPTRPHHKTHQRNVFTDLLGKVPCLSKETNHNGHAAGPKYGRPDTERPAGKAETARKGKHSSSSSSSSSFGDTSDDDVTDRKTLHKHKKKKTFKDGKRKKVVKVKKLKKKNKKKKVKKSKKKSVSASDDSDSSHSEKSAVSFKEVWVEKKKGNSGNVLESLMSGPEMFSWSGEVRSGDYYSQERRQRTSDPDDYDADYDRGRVKKVKSKVRNDRYKQRENLFQVFSNMKYERMK